MRLPGYATNRVAVVAIVVVGWVGVATSIEVGVPGVVVIVDDRRPEVSVVTNVVQTAVPVATEGKVGWSQDSNSKEQFVPRYAPWSIGR